MPWRITQAVSLTAALLGAVALSVPAPAMAYEPLQYLTTKRVDHYDQTFTVAPNTTQTFRLTLDSMRERSAALVPCWGYEITGPGIDVAAAGLHMFGWVNDTVGRYTSSAQRTPDGYYIPDDKAVVGMRQLDEGEECRQIGWSMFVGPDSGLATAAEVHRAKATHRFVRIRHPRKVKAPRANRVNDGSIRVPLAGVRRFPHERRMELVVTVAAGPLAGPTTITLHGRVLLPAS